MRGVLTTVTLLCIFIGALVYDFEIQVIGPKWWNLHDSLPKHDVKGYSNNYLMELYEVAERGCWFWACKWSEGALAWAMLHLPAHSALCIGLFCSFQFFSVWVIILSQILVASLQLFSSVTVFEISSGVANTILARATAPENSGKVGGAKHPNSVTFWLI